jgi:uncharacterized protein (TIGR04222 family)
LDWLHNPIADLSGPAFLLFYMVCAFGLVAVVALQARSASSPAQLPPLTEAPDPAELAYLRGGGNGLLRFTIFDLVRRNVLRIVPDPKGKNSDKLERVDSTETLSPLERMLADFYATERPGDDVFGTATAREFATTGDRLYGDRLRARGLQRSAAQRAASARTAVIGIAFLVALSVYRLVLAMVKHHSNVVFLVVLTVVAMALVAIAAAAPRLTGAGREYLKRVRAAYVPSGVGAAIAGAAALPLIFAVAGADALAGTPYSPMRTMFGRHAAGDGGCGSCSSGSSGSCSSGGSCGGGGGCGG